MAEREHDLFAKERDSNENRVDIHHDSAAVSAARALVVVRRRTGRPIPDKVLELAGTGWE